MARPLRGRRYSPKPPKRSVPKPLRSVTPLIYPGGKTRDVDWIVNEFPTHDCFVDVFGGGASVVLKKVPARVDVYNDVGNVVLFFMVLRDYPEELYEQLYYCNFSRQQLIESCARWQELMKEMLAVVKTSEQPYREIFQIMPEVAVQWAFHWYVTVIESHSHRELSNSFKVSKGNDTAMSFNNKVEEMFRFSERLRGVVIENRDFASLIKLYDTPDTLFYCDPPYIHGTRVSKDLYIHEMSDDRHRELVRMLQNIKGQVVVSMYHHPIYDDAFKDWRVKEITHLSGIQNTKSMADGRDVRTEVLWIKEHKRGLWSLIPPDVPIVPRGTSDEAETVSDGSRNTVRPKRKQPRKGESVRTAWMDEA